MSSVNQELYKEIENRASGTLKNIAIEILNQLSDGFASEERIKDEIRRKVDLAVREETK
ncbi:hypothetical protein [Acetivibrio straminisolvens]|uniref:Uncharacterized protein n=1 Tax=Acetivibrio straminisolvens JCM 21531 TaxID=1294263 RepID=W4V9D7_9FIRM|nr:hypothetical protein [Acetivibrio straminisolvens]GAE89408.1 hypothetical protein JCM21531_2933 [Acetivibrio straminisolvens JCM 21531]HOL87354.1 hypothetical protein [Defluviitoga tunisiensis]